MSNQITWEKFKTNTSTGKTAAELRADPKFNVTAFKIKHVTSKLDKADTNACFDLEIKPAVGNSFVIQFPDSSPEDRKLGSTREYTLQVDRPLNLYNYMQDANGGTSMGSMHMKVRAKDLDRDRNAWLPSHVQVSANIGGPDDVVLIDRTWPESNWFSGNESDAGGKAKPSWDLASV